MENYKLIGSTLAVKVPENIYELQIGIFSGNLMYCDKFGMPHAVELPEGSWSILGRPSELTDEQKELVIPIYKPSEKMPGYADIEVSYDGGKTFDDSVTWMENRTCMMAGIAGGHGYFKEGWGTTGNNGCDTGLISDPPDYWRYTDIDDSFTSFLEAHGLEDNHILLTKNK